MNIEKLSPTATPWQNNRKLRYGKFHTVDEINWLDELTRTVFFEDRKVAEFNYLEQDSKWALSPLSVGSGTTKLLNGLNMLFGTVGSNIRAVAEGKSRFFVNIVNGNKISVPF